MRERERETLLSPDKGKLSRRFRGTKVAIVWRNRGSFQGSRVPIRSISKFPRPVSTWSNSHGGPSSLLSPGVRGARIIIIIAPGTFRAWNLSRGEPRAVDPHCPRNVRKETRKSGNRGQYKC